MLENFSNQDAGIWVIDSVPCLRYKLPCSYGEDHCPDARSNTDKAERNTLLDSEPLWNHANGVGHDETTRQLLYKVSTDACDRYSF